MENYVRWETPCMLVISLSEIWLSVKLKPGARGGKQPFCLADVVRISFFPRSVHTDAHSLFQGRAYRCPQPVFRKLFVIQSTCIQYLWSGVHLTWGRGVNKWNERSEIWNGIWTLSSTYLLIWSMLDHVIGPNNQPSLACYCMSLWLTLLFWMFFFSVL